MRTKNKVVFVLIDALRSDYINPIDSPFLYSFAKENKYFKYVTQSRSFCERAEIFTGLSPRDSGFFTAIGYSPEKSPFRDMFVLNKLSIVDNLLGKSRWYKKVRNRLLRILTVNKTGNMGGYSIPLGFLPYFALTEDEYDFRDEKAFNGNENIFKVCKKSELNIFYDSFTALNFTDSYSDDDRLKLVESKIDKDYNLYMTYIGVLDSCAHKYGPHSDEQKLELKKTG